MYYIISKLLKFILRFVIKFRYFLEDKVLFNIEYNRLVSIIKKWNKSHNDSVELYEYNNGMYGIVEQNSEDKIYIHLFTSIYKSDFIALQWNEISVEQFNNFHKEGSTKIL